MNHPEISIDETTPVLQVKTNEGFQAALQRYAHGNGSSAGVAGAAVRALVAICTLVDVPKGYKVVLVPDEAAPNEPDWEECKRQAEVSTGLKVEPHTFSILKREVRRWIAHRHSCQAAPAAGVDTDHAEGLIDQCAQDWHDWQKQGRDEDRAAWIDSRRAAIQYFARALEAAAPSTPEAAPAAGAETARLANEEVVASWLSEQWHREVANRPLVNIHRAELDAKWRQLLTRVGVDHRVRLGPTHEELLTAALASAQPKTGAA